MALFSMILLAAIHSFLLVPIVLWIMYYHLDLWDFVTKFTIHTQTESDHLPHLLSSQTNCVLNKLPPLEGKLSQYKKIHCPPPPNWAQIQDWLLSHLGLQLNCNLVNANSVEYAVIAFNSIIDNLYSFTKPVDSMSQKRSLNAWFDVECFSI